MTELTTTEDLELGELQRAKLEITDAPAAPEGHTHGRGGEGGRHLERTFSRDPQAFAEPNSRQEIWRFAALPRLRALFAGPDADGPLAYSWSADAPVQVVADHRFAGRRGAHPVRSAVRDRAMRRRLRRWSSPLPVSAVDPIVSA